MFEEISKIGWLLWVWAILGFLIMRYLLGQLGKTKAWEHEPNEKSFEDDALKQDPLTKTSFVRASQWFEILEVSKTATLGEIKAAYKRKISQYHPDKVSMLGHEFQAIAERKSKEINAAYKFIERRHIDEARQ